jgi:hypothetical protein
LLFLPPTLESTMDGAPFEEVKLLRDELANMAWAVERIVENPISYPLEFGRRITFGLVAKRTKPRDLAPRKSQPPICQCIA